MKKLYEFRILVLQNYNSRTVLHAESGYMDRQLLILSEL